VGAWGPGIFQNDDALDLRDRWRGLAGAGFDPKDICRRMVDELQLTDNPDDAPSWLAIADLLWRAGRLTPGIKRRVLRIVCDGDLQRWDEPHRRARQHSLDQLRERLVSRMPAPVRVRPRHPCDWKRGEQIIWRTADGGSAVLRVVAFDRRWGGGGSPVVELVGAVGPDDAIDPTTLAYQEPRRALNALNLTTGAPWRGTRFSIGVFEPGAYPPRRVRRLRPSSSNRRLPGGKVKPIGTRWDALDRFLFRGFDLPWPRGTILRVPTDSDPVWLTVVDLMTLSGSPATMCEVLDWQSNRDPSASELRRIDTHRTADTVSSVRARVVDPRNRQSIAKMRRHLGVRTGDERAPFRVTLLGYPPPGVKVVGRRRVVVPASSTNAVEWTDVGGVVNRLVHGSGAIAMGDVAPAPSG
jgi:hypothetical protein